MRPFFIGNERRQDSDTESSVPSICYSTCNEAAVEAQQVGKEPALCDQDSTFSTLVDQCTECIKEGTKSGTASSDLVPPEFNQFIDYCASQGNGTDQINAAEVSTLLVAYSSAVASQSSLEAALSSKGYNFTTTRMDLSSTTPETRLTLTVSQTATGSPDGTDGPDTNSPNTKVIVPAVVVPVIFCLAAAAVIWALMRRRRRRMQQNKGDTDVFDGKAQLHADEFRPELEAEAMTTAKEKSTDPDRNSVVAELPARELVGSEMDATSQTADRRASS
ncbi:hypothetical protein ASPVEDRAFT_440636 [Aspergillus versicolor CBS 583.65]|uniref:Uncharacterized protein n=1 Tax=Aspergillus versicolor CBS 583.65 TaxID=1036611 RepID=A0A1L9P944_ASPVE|nr:uncharacterized protein ASPVEDRAFT_440636 [Aspergillus versicolor CBS 583.65]OJI98002.1 hypothetical protein ASPVEDRAFT_440636 [Aspergillus versicolor CBS 583.65]